MWNQVKQTLATVVVVAISLSILILIFILGYRIGRGTCPEPDELPTEEVAQEIDPIATLLPELVETVSALVESTPAPTTTPTATAMPVSTTAIPTSTPASSGYPLAGTTYSSPQGNEYNAVWTTSGWLWQPNLPPEGSRNGHVLSITIEEGRYTFNGVSCRLHLDEERNGQGADNPKTVGYGNGLPFEVDTADGGQAWAFIVCDSTDVTGFSIQYVGPLP